MHKTQHSNVHSYSSLLQQAKPKALVDRRAEDTQGTQGEPGKLDSRISCAVHCDSYDGLFYPCLLKKRGKGPAPTLITRHQVHSKPLVSGSKTHNSRVVAVCSRRKGSPVSLSCLIQLPIVLVYTLRLRIWSIRSRTTVTPVSIGCE